MSQLLTWYGEKVVPMNSNWKRVTISVSSNNKSFTNSINYRSYHIKNFPLFWQLAENKVLVWKIFEIYCCGSYFITPTPLTMIIIMYHLITYKNWSASWWSKLCSSTHVSDIWGQVFQFSTSAVYLNLTGLNELHYFITLLYTHKKLTVILFLI